MLALQTAQISCCSAALAISTGRPQALTDFNTLSDELRSYLERLGVSPEMVRNCRLPRCREAVELVATEADCYQRPQQLTPAAFAAWSAMKQAAARQQVTLQLISGFRSYRYQYELIQRKLDAGQSLSDILQVNAVPGFSQHHSGCAIDIGTPDCPALHEQFETTAAFHWLCHHAGDYGFYLSYPRDNPYAMTYEPWHWYFAAKPEDHTGENNHDQ